MTSVNISIDSRFVTSSVIGMPLQLPATDISRARAILVVELSVGRRQHGSDMGDAATGQGNRSVLSPVLDPLRSSKGRTVSACVQSSFMCVYDSGHRPVKHGADTDHPVNVAPASH